MNDLGINRVLTEMRALQARSKLPAQEVAPTAPTAPAQESKESGFVNAMADAVRDLNTKQAESGKAQEAFQLGRMDLATTMLKMQESSVAFRAAVEVRNRAVSAYQDIMNMPL
ncbi:flagellar hook-basal body complex protein FliE [Algiphilus sp.]|uniref:flagellar hook-basal body complex protein FliE n=1 Tax=Algiphilus sp. TaxID=1872431 RepID=UPI003B52DA68